MGKYSIRGSSAFDKKLDDHFDLVSRTLANSDVATLCRALVLIGGYGRGEGTPLIVDGQQQPFNDYDFVVVSVPMGRMRANAVQGRLRSLERTLSQEIVLPVDLQLYPANTLPHCEFSMLNYEMKYGHKVVWGDVDVLQAMPKYPHGQIPLSEGTRLLLNRGKLLLDVRRALRSGRILNEEERLRYVKFLFKAILAFGDCALLMTGAYDLSYAVKKKSIEEIVSTDLPDAAFVVSRYRDALELKEWGDYSFLPEYPLEDEFETVRKYYLRFLQWYEASRCDIEKELSPVAEKRIFRSPDQPAVWKSAALNSLTFGIREVLQGVSFLSEHPRLRLYRSLPVLLGDEPVGCSALSKLFLMPPAAGLEDLEDRFYQLHRRFS